MDDAVLALDVRMVDFGRHARHELAARPGCPEGQREFPGKKARFSAGRDLLPSIFVESRHGKAGCPEALLDVSGRSSVSSIPGSSLANAESWIGTEGEWPPAAEKTLPRSKKPAPSRRDFVKIGFAATRNRRGRAKLGGLPVGLRAHESEQEHQPIAAIAAR